MQAIIWPGEMHLRCRNVSARAAPEQPRDGVFYTRDNVQELIQLLAADLHQPPNDAPDHVEGIWDSIKRIWHDWECHFSDNPNHLGHDVRALLTLGLACSWFPKKHHEAMDVMLHKYASRVLVEGKDEDLEQIIQEHLKHDAMLENSGSSFDPI